MTHPSFSPLCFKRENGGTEKLSNMVKVTQPLSGGVRTYIPGGPTVKSLNNEGSGFCEF